MRPLCIVVVQELFKLASDACPTAHPRVMETVNSHFEGMKPLFDQVLFNIVELTAQHQPRKGSQIAVAIDEKHGVVEIMFLCKSMQERSGGIGTPPSEHGSLDPSEIPLTLYLLTAHHPRLLVSAIFMAISSLRGARS